MKLFKNGLPYERSMKSDGFFVHSSTYSYLQQFSYRQKKKKFRAWPDSNSDHRK